MSSASESKRRRHFRNQLHHWLRWIHIYVSMFSLLVVLFFALTGITLNHPEWTLGGKEVQQKFTGKLSADALAGGKVDWLKVVEQLRKEQPVHGAASDMRVDAGEGSMTFKAPGFGADCFFRVDSGEYELTTNAQGFVGVMNDLHRGRDSGSAWFWVVDFSGWFLAVLSLTGLGIMFYLKKTRMAGFVLAGVGTVVIVVLALLAIK